MKLVVIFDPLAVCKMTVGVELAKKTGLKLLHNEKGGEYVVGVSPTQYRIIGSAN